MTCYKEFHHFGIRRRKKERRKIIFTDGTLKIYNFDKKEHK